MAPYAFSITKKTNWRGVDELFSNVYHYDITGVFTEAQAKDIIDRIVFHEKSVHSSAVTFVSGRCWGPTDQGPSESETITVKDLTGAGSATFMSAMAAEMTYILSFYLGRAPNTGRKRFLRKFLHSRSGLGVTSIDGQFAGNDPLSSTPKATLTTFANNIKNLELAGGTYAICAPNGDKLPLLTDPVVAPYMHTRQFRQ